MARYICSITSFQVVIFMIQRHLLRRTLLSTPQAFFSEYPTNGEPPRMKPFDPVEHGLKADFVMTNYTKMKG